MSAFPRIFKVVREGLVQDVRVEDSDDLWRLRTELELLRFWAVGCDQRVRDALGRALRREHNADLADLCSILRDAAHPELVTCIARVDREAPDLRSQINRSVVRETAEQFRRDVAGWLRRSGLPEGENLAAIYEERVEILVRARLPYGTEADGDRSFAVKPTARKQEENSMTDQTKDAAVTDAGIQETPEAADRDGGKAASTEAIAQIEGYLNDALDCVKQAQLGASATSGAGADHPAPPDSPTDSEITDTALAAVEADVASLAHELGDPASVSEAAAVEPEPPHDPAAPPMGDSDAAPGMGDINSGVDTLSSLLRGELERLWAVVRELQSSNDEVDGVKDGARGMLAQIEAIHKQATGFLNEARLYRDETRNHRNEARKLVERITAFADDAAESADQARSEARTAIACAKHARRVGASADSQ